MRYELRRRWRRYYDMARTPCMHDLETVREGLVVYGLGGKCMSNVLWWCGVHIMHVIW